MLKHARKPNRWSRYDYSLPGYYFVTICTQFMMEWFGEIQTQYMCLNNYGAIVANRLFWLKDNSSSIEIDTWVVMPNHVHAIIHIMGNPVGTTLELSLQGTQNSESLTPRQRRHNLLSKTIGAFKTTSSKQIHLLGEKTFSWQRSFHDHIIRNEQELLIIRKYIKNNPRNWNKRLA